MECSVFRPIKWCFVIFQSFTTSCDRSLRLSRHLDDRQHARIHRAKEGRFAREGATYTCKPVQFSVIRNNTAGACVWLGACAIKHARNCTAITHGMAASTELGSCTCTRRTRWTRGKSTPSKTWQKRVRHVRHVCCLVLWNPWLNTFRKPLFESTVLIVQPPIGQFKPQRRTANSPSTTNNTPRKRTHAAWFQENEGRNMRGRTGVSQRLVLRGTIVAAPQEQVKRFSSSSRICTPRFLVCNVCVCQDPDNDRPGAGDPSEPQGRSRCQE